MIFLDTETCGLHGVAVLLQYARDDGEIKIHEFWRVPIEETLELLEELAEEELCFFNAAYDWFHLSKIYAMFSMFPDPSAIPEDHIDELAIVEEKARLNPLCLKPKSVIDLMLHARKGPYQSLMERSDIRIRRIPTRLAEPLASELEKRVELDGIYFSRRKDPDAPRWNIRDVHTPDGEINPDFKDIVLKFHASGALKVLAEHALGKTDVLYHADVELDKKFRPKEYGYAPFALAVGTPEDWKWAWPDVVQFHINHWAFNTLARRYAEDDITYTRDLWKHFDCPEPGDTDSELACMVGAVRWRGFAVDIEKLKKQRNLAAEAVGSAPTVPSAVKRWLQMDMSDLEQKVLYDGTGKLILESIAKWEQDGEIHPAAVKAQSVLDARFALKEIETLDKVIKAGRFHASFKVIGALSSRMSGADKLNPQGIKATDEIRECFTLAEPGFVLSGGDFESFEVTISEAVYKDPQLRKDLTTPVPCEDCVGSECKLCGGRGEYKKKIHGIFAQELFDMTYEEVIRTKGTSGDKYKKGKGGIFAMNFGGTSHTLQTRLGVSEEVADKAYDGFGEKYPGIGKARERIKTMFCSMRQPGGIGTQVEWHEPSDSIASLLGFHRYFTLENKICRALFELAQKPPESWKNVRVKVKRRDRLQTAAGAVQSALYAAAFAIQGSNMRAAANHEIQSSGAGITKEVQLAIWNVQPSGVHEWLVQPLNVHDEIMCPTHPDHVDEVDGIVDAKVEEFCEIVPLLEMAWSKSVSSWAGK